MKVRILVLLLLVCLLFSPASYADTFVVISNAGSGPGTLRWAIESAGNNGTAIQDYIRFNLTDNSREGRTIILETGLPNLSSNLVIDGTTQNGTPIAYSDAKIILAINTPQTTAPLTIISITGATNVQIYGLFLVNNVFTYFSLRMPVYGIHLYKSSNIIIGGPGRGNYFRGVVKALYSPLGVEGDQAQINCENIVIQSNIFGTDESGKPTLYNPFQVGGNYAPILDPIGYAIEFVNAKDVLFGGDNPNERNLVEAANIQLLTHRVDGNGYIRFRNNVSGRSPDGTVPAETATPVFIEIRNASGYVLNDYEVDFTNNLITGRIWLQYLKKFFSIKGNTIFRENNTGWSGADLESKLTIAGCAGGGIIGGELPEERNRFYNSSLWQQNTTWNSSSSTGSIIVFASPNVTITKNTNTCTAAFGAAVRVDNSNQPFVQIDSTGIGFVRGTATIGARIEIFQDDECWACDGKALLGETITDANGKWSFIGNFTGVVLATATKDNSTSGYTEPIHSGGDIVHPTCGMKNGSVTNIALSGSFDNVEWRHFYIDENGYGRDTLITRNKDLLNVGAGSYYFVAKLGETCRSIAQYFTLYDYTPVIKENQLFIRQPSCGKNDGAIKYLSLVTYDYYDYATYKWVNENGDILLSGNGSYIKDLEDVGPGKYRLIVTDTRAACADTAGWYTLTNASGPSLNDGNLVISPASCTNSNGSITGMTYTNQQGSVYMEWRDESNNIVSNSLDLINQPAGKYLFKFKDTGGCDTIITSYYIIPSTGSLTIDISNKLVSPAGCANPTGSIKNIVVTGADAVQWRNLTTQTTAGSTVDITSLSAGNYQLTATNTLGCELLSPVITVPAATFADIEPIHAFVFDGNCGENNGWLKLEGFTNEAALQSYYWINSNTGQQLGTSLSLTGLGAGTYEFIATDTNGCQATIFRAVLIVNSKPIINTSGIIIQPDQCDLKKGSITGIVVNGLVGPTSYQWTNTANMTIGHQADLLNIGAGNYQLSITDNQTCVLRAGPFIVANDNNAGITPQYDNTTIAKYSAATLTVKNLQPGTYSLYNDAAGTQLLLQNNTGQFTTPVLSEDRVFYIRHQSGSCSSPLVAVRITVVDKSFFAIPRAFTPNGDGLNDRLILQVIGYIEVNYFKVYNRNGEEVFSTKSIGQSWDGRWKGQLQPGGAYVWMAQGKDINGKTIQDKGSFILIR